MALCAKGGRVLGVLKEGVFFDKKYTHIRRYLLKNFIVKRVDSNPSDAFENTTTKTSNILFELPKEGENVPNDYNVEFYDVLVIKNTEDEFNSRNNFTLLNSASNGTIKEVKSVNRKTVSVKTILANDECSLNSKQYNNKQLVAGKGFKMVKLGDVCEFLPKSKRTAKFASDEGEYPFYTSSEIVKRCYIADYKDLSLIIGDGGKSNIHIDKLYSCSDHHHLLKCNISNNLYYFYYLFKSYMDILEQGFSGSVIKNISKKYLINLELPIPETDEQLEYWVNYISEPYNKIHTQEGKKEFNSRLEELRSKAILE